MKIKKPASAYEHESVDFIVWEDFAIDYGFRYDEKTDKITVRHHTAEEDELGVVEMSRETFSFLMARLMSDAALKARRD